MKTTPGPALGGSVFDTGQNLVCLVRNMGRSQLERVRTVSTGNGSTYNLIQLKGY